MSAPSQDLQRIYNFFPALRIQEIRTLQARLGGAQRPLIMNPDGSIQQGSHSANVVQLSVPPGGFSLKRVLEVAKTGPLFAVHRSINSPQHSLVNLVFARAEDAADVYRRYTEEGLVIDGIEVHMRHGSDANFLLAPELKQKMEGHGLSRLVVIWKPKKLLPKDFKEPEPLPSTTRQLHLWRDSTSFGNGPPLSYDHPFSKRALQEIFSGEAPSGLIGAQPGDSIDVELLPHQEEDYEPPLNRVTGYVSTKEREFAAVFGLENVKPASVVQLQPVHAAQTETHVGLVVEYTSVIEAARAVDELRVASPNSIFEFIADPALDETFIFKGPPPPPIPEYLKGAPPKPDDFPAEIKAREIKEISKHIGDKTLFWEKVLVVYKQRNMSKEQFPAEEARRAAQGETVERKHADWVCLACGRYNFGMVKSEEHFCYNRECGKDWLHTLAHQIAEAKAKEAELGQEEEEEEEQSYVEGNVVFLEKPMKTPGLPLIEMFSS